ncbi:MAG: hypothetical protein IIW21_03835, partial [Clostridia bacterium]|nr:hypothetical protein [Clostridia bacterium]
MKKRITALLILTTMLFASCSGGVTEAPETEPITEAVTDAPVNEIVISDANKCYYRTIIQTGSATTISEA